MRFSRLAIGYLCLALASTPVAANAAEAPLEMTPSSNWVMDYEDDSCALRRAFQGGDDQAMLELRQFGPGNDIQIVVASTTLSRTNDSPRVRFEPDDEFHEPNGAYILDDGETSGILYNHSLRPNGPTAEPGAAADWLPAEREARERAITALLVTESFRQDIALRTGSMRAPMEAMRACLDELLNHWGLDPAVQRTLSRPARPADLQSWARRVQELYPSEMLRRSQSGVVRIRLVVGPDGRPADCIPHKDFTTPGFAEDACEITMRYARFEPALDAAGVPVASFYTTTIAYQLYR